jgi:8-oxo-dGTP pyrophosphatase MutT (NUDIX family)
MELRVALMEELKLPLPGREFQQSMAPNGRPSDRVNIPGVNAAVSLIIRKTSSYLELILIRRPQYDGPHSGQVSFPGGKSEKTDNSLLETAIRETYEEIGIKLDHAEYLGPLTPLSIPVSKFLVYPFIFLQLPSRPFNIDPHEVEYVIHCPVSELVDQTNLRRTILTIDGFKIETPYFAINGETVWGATAMMLAEFKEIVRRIDKKHPGIFRDSGIL